MNAELGGADPDFALYNGIIIGGACDGMSIADLPVVDTRSTAKPITSVADLEALQSTDGAVDVTFMLGGYPSAPMGVIYVSAPAAE